MSKTRIHEYFVRESSDWDAVDFLNQCNVEPSNFEEKVDDYLKSLEFISNDKQQDSNRRQRAKSLLNKYRKGIRPDRQRVKSWLQEQLHKNRTGEETDRISVHLHNPTFADVASGIIHGGTINGGTIGTFGIEPSKKRSQEDNQTHPNPASNINIKRMKHETGLDDYDEEEVDEDLQFDLDSLIKSLEKEPEFEWTVGNVNITQRFRDYQKEIIKMLKTKGLTWKNDYEILALSSIIVLE